MGSLSCQGGSVTRSEWSQGRKSTPGEDLFCGRFNGREWLLAGALCSRTTRHGRGNLVDSQGEIG